MKIDNLNTMVDNISILGGEKGEKSFFGERSFYGVDNAKSQKEKSKNSKNSSSNPEKIYEM